MALTYIHDTDLYSCCPISMVLTYIPIIDLNQCHPTLPPQSVDSALESWDSSGLESNNAHKSNTTLKSSGHNNSGDSRDSHNEERGRCRRSPTKTSLSKAKKHHSKAIGPTLRGLFREVVGLGS